MPRIVTTLALVATTLTVAGGCSQDGGNSQTNDMGQVANPDLTPVECHGTLSNAMNGTFRPCEVQVFLGLDQAIRLKPTGYAPLPGQPMPMMIFFNMVASPIFKAQSYTIDTLADGTFFKVQNAANQAWFTARRGVNDNTGMYEKVGKIDVTITALPQGDPGITEWIDTHAHGTFDVDMPLEPGSVGRPDDFIHLEGEF